MRKAVWMRLFAGILTAAALVAIWPTFSDWWVEVLRALAVRTSGNAKEIVVPATASPAVPVVLAALVVLALPVRTRVALAVAAAASTLLAEILVVVIGSGLGLMPAAVNLLVAVPVGLPFVWLLAAVSLARSTSAAST